MNFSVLMSIYLKEKAEYLEQALTSLHLQTQRPSEIVLVYDGPVSKECVDVVEKFQARNEIFFQLVKLDKNQGLGKALAVGLLKCRFELVARMDSDDYAVSERFFWQINAFQLKPHLTILGGQIGEFDKDPRVIDSSRVLPLNHQKIVTLSKGRNPMNHMTIMFKKKEVLEVGNYCDWAGFEDYHLWMRLIKAEKIFENLPQILVLVRKGENFFSSRRGGLGYALSEWLFFWDLVKNDSIGLGHFLLTGPLRFIIRISPSFFRAFIYRFFMRKKSCLKECPPSGS